MKKIFKNWRKLLNEAEDRPKATYISNADIAKKHREAKKAAAAARAAEKYGPKTDGADTKGPSPEKPPFQKSGKMARRHRSRGGKGVGSWSPKEREKKNEAESDEPMPPMRGMMDPEDPSVMGDIERKKNQSFEDEVGELYADEVSALAMYMEDGITQRDEAIDILMHEPEFQDNSYSTQEMDEIWVQAQRMMMTM